MTFMKGWYFDIDTVIMKPLDAFIQRNILSTDQNYQKGMRPDVPDPKTGLVSLGHSLNAI